MSLSPRVTRGSLRHLSPDFDWNLLEQQSSHFTATEAHVLSTADSKGKEKKDKKDKKKQEGAIPKTRPSDSTSASLQFPSDLPSPEYDQAGTPPSTRDEIIRLQLVKDNHDREICKLELRLQLAQLENKTVSLPPGSTETSTSKSLGDMKAPQKIVNPQQWPHIFAPGEPKLYVDLSLAKFCAGYLVIITQLADKPLREPVIAHFHELMILASTYQWSAVRSYHYKVLLSIELGLVQWGGQF